MSDTVNTPPPETPPAPRAEGEVLTTPAPVAPVSAKPAAMAPVPLGDHDTSILSHLGIPFYYRHSPNRTTTRGAIWITFLTVLAVIFMNVVYMPYDKDTFMYSIRATLFHTYGGYPSAEDGARAMFNQCFVVAIIISGIIAPLYATFSFSSERVLGTLEFLRLSPMSTLSIVMGKMFAPAYVLHLISGLLLTLGFVFGLCGGVPAYDMGFAVLAIIFSSAMFNAVGAFLAVYTSSFRGFGAVSLLLFVGLFVSIAPVEFLRERGVAAFAYISPWGVMDNLFWNVLTRWRSSTERGMILGSESLMLPTALATYGLFFSLLVWAASRRLDKPERPALPWGGYVILWSFFVVIALAITPNFDITPQKGFYVGGRPWEWASIVVFFGTLGTSIMALLDHPHQREVVLTEECERVAGREQGLGGSWRRMGHAVFVAVLVLASGLVMTAMLFHAFEAYNTGNSRFATNRSFEWSVAALVISISVVSAFLFSIIVECAWVRFTAFWVKLFVAGAVIAAFMAALITPMVHVGSTLGRFNTVVYTAISTFANNGKAGGGYRYNDMNWLQTNPDYAIYIPGTETMASAQALRDTYGTDPVGFFWHYHTQACLIYPMVFLALIALLFYWRRRTYMALRREAVRAVGTPAVEPVAV